MPSIPDGPSKAIGSTVGLTRTQLHSSSQPDTRFSFDELDSAIAQHSLNHGDVQHRRALLAFFELGDRRDSDARFGCQL
jgi:hypothetical protein